jgi:gluconolactonase
MEDPMAEAATNPDLMVVAKDLGFPEGPVFDAEGHLYVCEMGHKPPRVARISPDGTVDTFVETGGCPNGAAISPDGRLWACDNRLKAIIAVTLSGPDEKKIETICKECNGQPFKGPNDIIFDAVGNAYFSDPVGSGAKNPIGCVYRWDAKAKTVSRVIEKLAYPNGVVLSDDFKTLYVAETEAKSVWAYPIKEDGSVGERKLAGELKEGHGPDGIALDSRGRLLAAWYGGSCVAVFDPAKGELIKKVALPDENPTNLEFGGARRDVLYITCTKTGTVRRLKWDCPGQKLAGEK